MKTFLLAVAVMIGLSVSAQSKVDSLIKFEKTSYAFGKVKQNKPVTYEFKFTNPGKSPLIIESAEAECGCTKPVFPSRPVMKGKSATIKVTYDAKTMGSFTKKVTVKLVNVTETKVLTITGEVVE